MIAEGYPCLRMACNQYIHKDEATSRARNEPSQARLGSACPLNELQKEARFGSLATP
jgi:hypothetical protein